MSVLDTSNSEAMQARMYLDGFDGDVEIGVDPTVVPIQAVFLRSLEGDIPAIQGQIGRVVTIQPQPPQDGAAAHVERDSPPHIVDDPDVGAGRPSGAPPQSKDVESPQRRHSDSKYHRRTAAAAMPDGQPPKGCCSCFSSCTIL